MKTRTAPTHDADIPYLAIADLATHCKDVSIIRVRTKSEFINVGDVLIVERCGGCNDCGPESFLLVKVMGKYVVKRKQDLPKIRRLRLAGTPDNIVIIGRLLGWVSPFYH